eukprot:4072824-Pleurochrysis_carterae.AAC.6
MRHVAGAWRVQRGAWSVVSGTARRRGACVPPPKSGRRHRVTSCVSSPSQLWRRGESRLGLRSARRAAA